MPTNPNHTYPPSDLLHGMVRKDRSLKVVCNQRGTAVQKMDTLDAVIRATGSWKTPAHLGSVRGPRETLYQGTALLYTSFLGLSERKEKQIDFQTAK